MKLNRRNVLVGIGTAAVGSGVALGSGAFTQVEATRNVNMTTSDDASALLQIAEHTSGSAVVSQQTGQGDNSVSLIQLERTDLNEDALTQFDDAITVTNNGTQDVGFYVQTISGQVPDALDFEETGGPSTIAGSANAVTINSGSSVDLNVIVDLTGAQSTTDLPADVTFDADASLAP
jgi:hypothetical protein